jgi:membrane fusion protein, multidrug efflux system
VAVQRGPVGAYVFVVDTSHIVGKRPVKVGLTNGAVAVIDQGIEPGDLVITDGQYRVQAGTTVSIMSSSVPSS